MIWTDCFICDFCIRVLDVKILIVIICPNILLFRILKIPSATPGDNLILWTSAVRSLTGPDSLVGWPQICGCYVISLPPKWGAPWGTLCYHSLIVGPFFRRLSRLIAPVTWWRHQMKTFSALLALCERNPPVDSPHKGQVHGALMFSLIYVCTNGWTIETLVIWDAVALIMTSP